LVEVEGVRDGVVHGGADGEERVLVVDRRLHDLRQRGDGQELVGGGGALVVQSVERVGTNQVIVRWEVAP